MLRPADPEGMRATWAALEAEWAKTIARARARSPRTRCTSRSTASGRSSQTLRHLVFAMDKWFTAPILGEAFDPIGTAEHGLRRLPVAGARLRPDAVGRPKRSPCAPIAPTRFRDYLATVAAGRLHPTGRRARERHEPAAGVPLHRVRRRVLAQPLRLARPRAARRIAEPVSSRAPGAPLRTATRRTGRRARHRRPPRPGR